MRHIKPQALHFYGLYMFFLKLLPPPAVPEIMLMNGPFSSSIWPNGFPVGGAILLLFAVLLWPDKFRYQSSLRNAQKNFCALCRMPRTVCGSFFLKVWVVKWVLERISWRFCSQAVWRPIVTLMFFSNAKCYPWIFGDFRWLQCVCWTSIFSSMFNGGLTFICPQDFLNLNFSFLSET